MIERDLDPMKEVIGLCEEANKAFPKSKGAHNARNLYNSVFQKKIDGQIEQVVLPGESNLLFLSTRNLTDIHVKLVSLTESEWLEWGRSNDRKPYKFLFQKPALLSFEKNLTRNKSYYKQNAEIEIPPLSFGYYGVLITEKGKEKNAESAYLASKLIVSKLGYIMHNEPKGSDLIVFDRDSGNPIESAQVDIFQSYYSRDARKHITELVEQKLTDSEGRIQLSVPENNQANFTFRIKKDSCLLYTSPSPRDS